MTAQEGYFCDRLQSEDKKLECDVEQVSRESDGIGGQGPAGMRLELY